MSSSFSRRQLFKLRLGDVGNLVRQARQTLAQEKAAEPQVSEDESTPTAFIRPPGAIENEEAFLDACERCHNCIEACPYEDVIQFFGPSHGPREGSPFLKPDEAPCRWCFDMPCAHACPTEALQVPETGDDGKLVMPAIAIAVLDLETCLNNQGTICDTCALMCPPHVKAIKMINRQPLLDPQQCTGCGMCAYYCESEPGSITIVPIEASAEA